MRHHLPIPGLICVLALTLSACASTPDLRADSAPPTGSPVPPFPTAALPPSPTPAVLETRTGNLRAHINRLLDHLPQPGSNAYLLPTENDRAEFTGIVQALETGQFDRALEAAIPLGYRLIEYTDHGDHDAVSYLLEERAPIQRGWGMYVFRKDAANNLIVEAPHPMADANTARVALDAYRALDARALLVAGAHRDANEDGSADVSHAPGSIFQTVHAVLAGKPLPTLDAVLVLQIHGFDSDKHPNYPDVVLGYDLKTSPALAARVVTLKDALTALGLHVGVCDNKSWESLCGTRDILNVVPNGIAIHIELNESVRAEDGVFIQALMRAFGLSPRP